MNKNKWRLAFWISILILLVVSVIGLYSVMDQGVTITYMKDGYTNTENDLNSLVEIINETNLTKSEIEAKLKTHRFFEFMDFKKDTIPLERISLIFENDTLRNIENQW
jgi:phosphoglycerate-specific signal transduction histidine kinase